MFLVFKGRHYYPYGGWGDFVDAFDTLDAAIEVANDCQEYSWAQVVDLSTREIVWKR